MSAGFYDPSKNNGILRIGFDVDGVLSHFSPSYQRVIAELTGKDLFLPGDAENPPTWDWDLYRGYTKEERARAFAHISAHRTFWYDCAPLQGLFELKESRLIDSDHEIYFITNRAGFRVKHQTESWFSRWLDLYVGHTHSDIYPTVCVNGHRSKGLMAKALQLDAYIDDNSDNVMDCLLAAPSCKTVLLNASYNQTLPSAEEWVNKNPSYFGKTSEIERVIELADRSRVSSVGEFLRSIGVGRS
jgi:hypothetical protein